MVSEDAAHGLVLSLNRVQRAPASSVLEHCAVARWPLLD